jgi:hypothetical protein
MTTMRPHHAMASLLIVGIAAIAVGWADRAGSAGGAEPAPKESTSTGHEGHQMPATTTTTTTETTTTAAKPAAVKGRHTTITGEVMDPACFLEAGAKSISPGHFQCAIDCARSGQTLAIYDRANDRIYFLAGEMPGKNPNDPVINFIHQKVDVTGVVYHRSGVYGIVITKVVPHKDKG